jgi:hypothetical protein
MKGILLHHATATLHTLHIKPEGYDASHLCHHTLCKTIGHVIWEPVEDNQRRKNCLVWVECHHQAEGCLKKQWVCQHSPPCIKAINGVTYEDFVRNGHDYYFHPAV